MSTAKNFKKSIYSTSESTYKAFHKLSIGIIKRQITKFMMYVPDKYLIYWHFNNARIVVCTLVECIITQQDDCASNGYRTIISPKFITNS